jgi:glycosyltransferase involved in cell wall biosynthesis
VTRRRPLRVLAISPIPEEGAGCRFRIAQYIPRLREHGLEVTVSPFYSKEFFRLVYQPGHFLRKAVGFLWLFGRRLAQVLRLNRYDLVFLYREAVPLGPPIVEWLVARSGVPVVFDFDDAIFLPNVSDANRAVAFLKRPGRVASVIRRAARVVAGNEFLAAYARQHHGRVTVIPTVVDTDRWVPRPADLEPRARAVVGWIGSPTTYPFLKAVAPLLRDVHARHPFTLKVSGAGEPVDLPGLDVDDVPWSLGREVELFNTCDIGVYPLPDDDWARGKCGFKAIQCMACGVPVVASAVGVNREIIEDGVNSFLAADDDDFRQKLERLLADSELRARLAQAGRRTIEERYSLAVTAPALAALLREAAETIQ